MGNNIFYKNKLEQCLFNHLISTTIATRTRSSDTWASQQPWSSETLELPTELLSLESASAAQSFLNQSSSSSPSSLLLWRVFLVFTDLLLPCSSTERSNQLISLDLPRVR